MVYRPITIIQALYEGTHLLTTRLKVSLRIGDFQCCQNPFGTSEVFALWVLSELLS